MRAEVLAEIRWLRVQKGFSEKGILRHTGLPLDVVRAAIEIIDNPPKAARSDSPSSSRPDRAGEAARRTTPEDARQALARRADRLWRSGDTLREVGDQIGTSHVTAGQLIREVNGGVLPARGSGKVSNGAA